MTLLYRIPSKEHPPYYLQEAQRSGLLIYCIVDDAIAYIPGLRHRLYINRSSVFSPITFKGRQDTGIRLFLSCCNGTTLNYAVILYDESNPGPDRKGWRASCGSYFLWQLVYFFKANGQLYGRFLYDRWWATIFSILESVESQFVCPSLRKQIGVSLVGGRQFYVYRWRELNGIPNAAIISYRKMRLNPKALQVILYGCRLSTLEILETYISNGGTIELFSSAKVNWHG